MVGMSVSVRFLRVVRKIANANIFLTLCSNTAIELCATRFEVLLPPTFVLPALLSLMIGICWSGVCFLPTACEFRRGHGYEWAGIIVRVLSALGQIRVLSEHQ